MIFENGIQSQPPPPAGLDTEKSQALLQQTWDGWLNKRQYDMFLRRDQPHATSTPAVTASASMALAQAPTPTMQPSPVLILESTPASHSASHQSSTAVNQATAPIAPIAPTAPTAPQATSTVSKIEAFPTTLSQIINPVQTSSPLPSLPQKLPSMSPSASQTSVSSSSFVDPPDHTKMWETWITANGVLPAGQQQTLWEKFRIEYENKPPPPTAQTEEKLQEYLKSLWDDYLLKYQYQQFNIWYEQQLQLYNRTLQQPSNSDASTKLPLPPPPPLVSSSTTHSAPSVSIPTPASANLSKPASSLDNQPPSPSFSAVSAEARKHSFTAAAASAGILPLPDHRDALVLPTKTAEEIARSAAWHRWQASQPKATPPSQQALWLQFRSWYELQPSDQSFQPRNSTSTPQTTVGRMAANAIARTIQSLVC